MKTFLIFLTVLLGFNTTYAQENVVGQFNRHKDIGSPQKRGSATYNETTQTYTLEGAGYNIWFERDEFHYLYNKMEGDFILTANFDFIGEGENPHRKIGWMIRGSEKDNAAHISAVSHGDGLTVLQWRALRGAFMRDPEDEIFAPKADYQTLQIERKGKQVIMRAAHPGEPLQTIGSHKMENLSGEVLAGPFICSHNPGVVEKARTWNVRIDKPEQENDASDQQTEIFSRLETMNVFNGKRKVVHKKKGKMEAPNWMPNGNQLLFNRAGSLYTIPVKGGTPEQLNTGFANRLNNDHGISFNGELLAISHHREGLPGGGSSVYVLPIDGGTPELVTEQTPSYWHGWAPNNKEVVYVGQRDGESIYDIYKKSIEGGKEVALTANESGEHVDGPEYSPDGQYIYYNSSESGTMQLWRMHPDGSNKEQLTFDQYNDWFPHISPDGKWIAFISFPAKIPVNDHPANKRVMLRLMPTSGGAPKVIGYLYGGQGTINVPSWSPDSKQISFVSYSYLFDF